MAISETKMQIVIANYFKDECDVNTSIRQAFEKGFRIGVKKGANTNRPQGKWMWDNDYHRCSNCRCAAPLDGEEYWTRDKIREDLTEICPNCGAKMKGAVNETDY